MVSAYIAQYRFFAVLQAVGAKVPAAAIRTAIIILSLIVRDSATQVKKAVVNKPKVGVVCRRDIERHQAIVNSVQIHFDGNWLFCPRFFVFLIVLLRVLTRLLVCLGFVFVSVLGLVVRLFFVLVLLLTYFVAARSERVLGVLGKRHEIHALQVAIHIVKIGLVEDRFKVSARGEHQILSVVAEGGVIRRIPIVGHRR